MKYQIFLLSMIIIFIIIYNPIYNSIFVFFTIILSLCFILTLKTKNKYLILLIILILYKNNLFLAFNIIYIVSNLPDNNGDEYIRLKLTRVLDNIFNVKTNFSKLPDYPCLMVGNYVRDRMDQILFSLIPRKVATLARYGRNYKIFARVLEYTIPTYKGCFEELKTNIKDHISKDINVFCYVSEYNKGLYDGIYIKNLHTSMFKIGKELNIPILPIAFDYIEFKNGTIPKQNLEIFIGDVFKVDNLEEDIFKTKKFFRDNLKRFKAEKFIL